MNKMGLRTQPWGTPVFRMIVEDVEVPKCNTCRLLISLFGLIKSNKQHPDVNAGVLQVSDSGVKGDGESSVDLLGL